MEKREKHEAYDPIGVSGGNMSTDVSFPWLHSSAGYPVASAEPMRLTSRSRCSASQARGAGASPV